MTGDDNKFGLEVRVLGAGGLGLSANKWTDQRAAGCAGHLKTSGTDTPHCLQSLIIPRTRICCRPGLITLQHLEPAHCSTAGSADIPRPGRRHAMRGQGWDWPEEGVSRGAKAIQWPGDEWHHTGARIRKRKSEPTQSPALCPVIMGTCHGARSAKNSGKWRSPVSPAGPCLVQIRTLRSPMSLVLSTRHRFPRPLALAANLETSTSRHVSNVVIACWS